MILDYYYVFGTDELLKSRIGTELGQIGIGFGINRESFRALEKSRIQRGLLYSIYNEQLHTVWMPHTLAREQTVYIWMGTCTTLIVNNIK